MSGNTFGRLFRVTTFGESHGPGLGCIIDGVPAGIRGNKNGRSEGGINSNQVKHRTHQR